jgi:murein DD-endopeptidase MepM/ murein hydrolase activator NlpD
MVEYRPMTRTLRLVLLCGVLLLVEACGSGTALAPPTSGPTPGPGNRVVPLLGRPFQGDYGYNSAFDHEYPTGVVGIGWELTFRGTRLLGLKGHTGWDWALPRGTPVLAAADGEVVFAGTLDPFYCPLPGINREVLGQLAVILRHTSPDGTRFLTRYDHLDRVDVAAGSTVREAQVIGLSGNTGCTLGPHLHFEVALVDRTRTGRPTVVDPYGWEGRGQDPWVLHPEGAESVWMWKPGAAPPAP